MAAVLPFESNIELSQEQHQIVALAAVFQAAQIVHHIATKGAASLAELDTKYTTVLLQSALSIRPTENQNKNSLVFFHSLAHLGLGLRCLEQSLIAPYDPQARGRSPRTKIKNTKLTLNYTMALLHLSAKVYSSPDFQTKISRAQQNIMRQLSFFNHDYHHPSIISALAQVYTETASTMKPRIMVKGNEQAFKNPHEVAQIRAMLFTGLQAAHYWRNLGGSPWKLIFSKAKIIKQIQNLAKLQHLNQPVDVSTHT